MHKILRLVVQRLCISFYFADFFPHLFLTSNLVEKWASALPEKTLILKTKKVCVVCVVCVGVCVCVCVCVKRLIAINGFCLLIYSMFVCCVYLLCICIVMFI